MTRLTDPLFRKKRNADTIKRFMNYTPTFKHRGVMMPPVLGNRVSEMKPKAPQDVCLDELQAMMSCWKRNEFKENTCQVEYLKYGQCITTAREAKAKLRASSEATELGSWTTLEKSSTGKMKSVNAAQLNKLLRMYPQPAYKVSITQAHGQKLKNPYDFNQKKPDYKTDKKS